MQGFLGDAIDMCFTVGFEKKPQITQIKNIKVQHPPPSLPHRGGGNIFPRPLWEGFGEGAELLPKNTINLWN